MTGESSENKVQGVNGHCGESENILEREQGRQENIIFGESFQFQEASPFENW